MLNTEDFKVRLEQIFSFYSLTPATFSEQIGVQRSSLSHLLSGRNKPSLDFILKIEAHYPAVDLYWLLHGKGVFPKSEISVSDQKPTFESANQKTKLPQLHSILNKSDANLLNQKNASENFVAHKIENENKVAEETVQKEKTITNESISKIRDIIIFYEDGTFENFIPKV